MTTRESHKRALGAALVACAVLGWSAAAAVLVDRLTPPEAWPRAVLCLTWLVFAPLGGVALGRLVGRVPRIGPLLARCVPLCEALPLFLLPTPVVDALLFGPLLLVQGHLLLASGDGGGAARASAASPLTVVIALAYAPSGVLLALLPASGLAAVVVLVLSSSRRARRRLGHRKPAVESAAALRRRLLYALPLGVCLLALSATLFLLLTVVLDGTADDGPLPPVPLQPDAGGADRAHSGGEGGRAGRGGGRPGDFTAEVALDGGPALATSDEPTLYLRPLAGGPRARSVYLRHTVLDTFTAASVRLGDRRVPPVYRDGDDGALDGWTWLRAVGPGTPTRDYAVRMRRRSLGGQRGWALVVAPHPLLAVSLPRMRYDPDRVQFAVGPSEEWFDYELRQLERPLSARTLRATRAGGVHERYLQLPAGSPALPWIEEYARLWIDGGTSDYDRVRSVVEHLRRDFSYERSGLGFGGPEALASFLEERRGYCTYFASASALILRTRGIPTRVATGFLAHEWSESEGRWIVRERDAHAWLEVAFEGVGWVTFDPTPPEVGGSLSSDVDDAEVEETWEARLTSELERWLSTGGERGSLGDVLRALAVAPLEILEGTPSLWLLPSALGFLALHFLFARRRRVEGHGAPSPVLPPATHGLYRELLRALSAHGHRRRRGQTQREFARQVARVPGAAFAAVGEVIELYYRARFGGQALEAGELRFVEGVVKDLDQSQARERSGVH